MIKMRLLFNTTRLIHRNVLYRSFSFSPVVNTKEWRESKGLPANRNSEGVLLDGPDYTFLDGRPTPLLHKQKLRILKQKEFASKIVEFCGEVDFAKERHQNMLKAAEEEKQRVIDNRLQPKGKALKK